MLLPLLPRCLYLRVVYRFSHRSRLRVCFLWIIYMFELIKSFMFFLAHPHVYTPTDSSLPPCCLAWHQFPLSQMVTGEGEIQRETEREWQQLTPGVYVMPTPPIPFIHTFFSIHQVYLLHTSSHLPPSRLYLLFLECILFITTCFHLSIRTLSTVSECAPTAIHPPNPPICQSAPQTRSHLVSWPLTRPLTFEIWPFSHPSFSLHPSIHPPIPCSTFCQRVKTCRVWFPIFKI